MFGLSDKIDRALKKTKSFRAQEIYWNFLGTVPAYGLKTDWEGYVAYMANNFDDIFSEHHPADMYTQYLYEVHQRNLSDTEGHAEMLKWDNRRNSSYGNNAESAEYFRFAAYLETCRP